MRYEYNLEHDLEKDGQVIYKLNFIHEYLCAVHGWRKNKTPTEWHRWLTYYDKENYGAYTYNGRGGGTYANFSGVLDYAKWADKEFFNYIVDKYGRNIEMDSMVFNNGRSRIYAQREHGAICAIEQILGVKLKRRYKVGKYFIDGYDSDNNIAYEIDERQHRSKDGLRENCFIREREIAEILNCSFVRIEV